MADGTKGGRKPRGTKAKPAARKTVATRKPAAKGKQQAQARPGARQRRRKLSEADALELIRADVHAEGALPKREQLVLIGRQLYAGWLSGRTYRSLAEEHNLSAQGVEKIVMEYRRAKVQVVPGPASALLMVHGYLDQLHHSIGELAEIAADQKDKNPAVQLGAIKQKGELMRQLLDVWQELGWLPRHLGTLNVAMDAVAMVDAILDVMDRRGVPEDVQRELVEAVELRFTRKDGRPSVDLSDAPVIEGTGVAA